MAGIQNVQVLHRGYRVGWHRQGRTEEGLHRADLLRTASQEANAENDSDLKAEQEKRRCEEALANANGIRVLQSILPLSPFG